MKPINTIRIRRAEAKFAQHHAENPHFYVLFNRFTWQVVKAGHKNYSARAIFHRIRWYTDIETTDPKFKINNNHSPYYARMWMMDNPEHEGFFRERELRTELIEVDGDEYEIRGEA